MDAEREQRRLERLAQRGSGRKKLPLDDGQIVPAHDHRCPKVFFLDQSSVLLPVKAAASFSDRAKARTSGLFFVEAFDSLPVVHHQQIAAAIARSAIARGA